MFKYLQKYLKLNNVSDDIIKEFKVQIQSHPNYPSLLAISDTLSFLDIDNGAFPISFGEIHELPQNFIALLKDEEQKSVFPKLIQTNPDYDKFWLYEEEGSGKFKEIEKELLGQQWAGTVFLAEGEEKKQTDGLKLGKYLLPSAILASLLLLFYFANANIYLTTFMLLSVVGLYITYEIINEQYTDKSGALQKLCSINTNTSCNQVLSSKKWQVFDYLNFSDLSLYLFSGQLLIGLTAILTDQSNTFELITCYGLVFLGLPVISLSIYYQKFVERKWCPLCLLISSTVVIQTSLLFTNVISKQNLSINIEDQGFRLLIVVTVLIAILIYTSWNRAKQALSDNKQLKKEYIKIGKTVKDYDLFKLALLNGEKKTFSANNIIVGNSNDQVLTISFATNPHCSFCEEIQQILSSALQKQPDKLKIKLILLGHNKHDEAKSITFNGLASSYLSKGGEQFFKAYSAYLQTGATAAWQNTYIATDISIQKTEELLEDHHVWAYHHEINFTPALYINGYAYPKAFDYANLRHFIPFLIEDEAFTNRRETPAIEPFVEENSEVI